MVRRVCTYINTELVTEGKFILYKTLFLEGARTSDVIVRAKKPTKERGGVAALQRRNAVET